MEEMCMSARYRLDTDPSGTPPRYLSITTDCSNSGECYRKWPELFDSNYKVPQETSFARFREHDLGELNEDQVDRILESCPRGAIRKGRGPDIEPAPFRPSHPWGSRMRFPWSYGDWRDGVKLAYDPQVEVTQDCTACERCYREYPDVFDGPGRATVRKPHKLLEQKEIDYLVQICPAKAIRR